MNAANFRGYALGVNVTEYQGRQMLTHTGGLPGYLSQVTMIPELRLGVAVLTNQESGSAFQSITFRALDSYLGLPAHDYAAIYAKMDEAARRGQDTGISRYRRELEAQNRDKIAVFIDGHFGVFRTFKVMLLVGVVVRERAMMGGVRLELFAGDVEVGLETFHAVARAERW